MTIIIIIILNNNSDNKWYNKNTNNLIIIIIIIITVSWLISCLARASQARLMGLHISNHHWIWNQWFSVCVNFREAHHVSSTSCIECASIGENLFCHRADCNGISNNGFVINCQLIVKNSWVRKELCLIELTVKW